MILKLQHVSVFYINHHQGASSNLIKLLLVYSCFLSMLAACLEIIHNLLVIIKECYIQSDNIVKCYIIYNYSFLIRLIG